MRKLGNAEVVLTGRRLQIVRLGDRQLLIRSGGQWFYALLMLVCCALMAFSVLICAVWVYMATFRPAPQSEQNVAVWVCGFPCLAFFAVMLAAMIYSLLMLALPRRTLIDLGAETIHLHQIPGLSRQLRLGEVSTVDLVMFPSKGVCHLGFTNSQTGALFSCHWLAGQFDSALDNRNQLLPAARLISQFIDKPLESSWGHMGWRSIQKGASETIPA